jgi:hypothetical protein
MTYYDWQITHSEVMLQVSDKPESRYTKGTRESALCQNSQNSDRAPTLVQTRARKTRRNTNEFRQSFPARATPRTLDKPGSPPALKTSPLFLLFKE